MNRLLVSSFLGVACAAVVACSSSSDHPPASSGPGADAGANDSGTQSGDGGADAGTGILPPDSPAGRALTFVLAALNGAKVTDADVTMHFSKDFIAAVPPAQTESLFSSLSPNKPWTLSGFEGKPASTSLTAILTRNDGQYWRAQIATAAGSDLIDGIYLDAAGDLDPSLATFAAVDAKLSASAPEVSELAATIDASGNCTATHSLAADQSRALGSQFKLWILATLAQSIDQGMHAWTDNITIQDQYKSLPSGTFQNQANGTMLSVTAFVENMISISDNTAADHLLWFLGRDQVEAMMTTTKHHDPTLNQPFLTTRELFDLKLMVTEPDRQTYIADGVADKRAALANYDTTLDPRNFAGTWVNPIDIDKLEWFATPTDLCNVMATLKTYGDKSGTSEVYHALSINPGLADDAHLFSYVGYKGGSEPGVLTMSWLLRRASDQAWVFYSVEFNDPNKPIDEDATTYLALAGRALVGKM